MNKNQKYVIWKYGIFLYLKIKIDKFLKKCGNLVAPRIWKSGNKNKIKKSKKVLTNYVKTIIIKTVLSKKIFYSNYLKIKKTPKTKNIYVWISEAIMPLNYIIISKKETKYKSTKC